MDLLPSLIEKSIKAFKIPHEFSEACLAEARKFKPPKLKDFTNRTNLTHIPLVTIDGEDARDFDDAVYAEPWKNGGFYIIVAIADVAYYVRPGTALDYEARERGNSVYFPGFCVPMLPEELSNGICSLKPNVLRLVLAKHLYYDATGKLVNSRTEPSIIRSHARTTYKQVQQFLDGDKKALPKGMKQAKKVKASILCFAQAYLPRLLHRQNHFTAEFNTVVKHFSVTEKGRVSNLEVAKSFCSNNLIEEAMVLANYDAGKIIHNSNLPSANRVHHNPEGKKLERFRALIHEYGLSKIPTTGITPELLHNYVLAVPEEHRETFKTVLLSTSEKAYYTQHETGHFGLALEYYAHFTSPIRRYSDILIHRAHYQLLKFLGWEEIGILPDEYEFEEICEHVSGTEINATNAYRHVDAQLTATHYTKDVNNRIFSSKIARILYHNKSHKPTGVIVSFDDGLGEAYVRISNIKDDKYKLAPNGINLIGTLRKQVLKVGTKVEIRLIKADVTEGQIEAIIIESTAKPRQNRNTHIYKNRLDETFTGKITGTSKKGITLIFDEDVQCFIHMSSLTDDYYEHTGENEPLTGRQSNKSFKIGDELPIKLIKIHQTKRITAELAAVA